MFQRVLEQESPQIQPGYKPLIPFMMCVKRHHTRFFLPAALRWAEKKIAVLDVKKYNIEQRTVVDLEVCDTQKFDFYMLSHYPSHPGTPRPTHYYILYDNAKFM